MPRYYEEVEIGDELGPLEKVVNRDAVIEFSSIWGGQGKGRGFFTDPEAAEREGLPGVIVPGPMSMAFMAQLLTSWADGGWIRKLDVVFRQPVPHDTPLRVVGVVTDKFQEGGEGLVECDVYLENGERERLVGGQAVVILPTGPQ